MTSNTTHYRIAHLANLTRELSSRLRTDQPASLAVELRQRAMVCEHLDMIAARLDVLEGEVLVSEARASQPTPPPEPDVPVQLTLRWEACAVCVGLVIVGLLVMVLGVGRL